jgi:hypothetical protein
MINMKHKVTLPTLFLLFSSFAFSQSSIDSTHLNETYSAGLTAKQMRMHKDSLAKSLVPIQNKAIVFIVRPSIMGMAIPFRLDCDSFQIGWIHAKTYLYTILDSGEHEFKALSENEFHLKVKLEAGKIYYLEQESKMGMLYARTKLKLLDPEAGKNYLSKCKISNQNRYPMFPLSKDVEKSPPKGD